MTQNIRIALDIGRSRWKAALANHITVFSESGLSSISEGDYYDAMKRDGGQFDYLQHGNSYYALGEQALSYRSVQESATASRYNRVEIGVPAINMIARLLKDRSSREFGIDVIISHPPGDSDHAEDLKNAVLGDWHFTTGGEQWNLYIERVFTYDEPISILMNTLLTVDGKGYQRKPEGTSIVFDMGGATFDITGTLRSGKVDQARVRGDKIGVNDIQRQFFSAVMSKHPSIFRDQKHIHWHLIQDAFKTGWFKGGKTIDCRQEAQRYRDIYLHDIMEFVRNNSGGLLNYSTVILGGGGAALFADDLLEIIDHDNIVFADKELDNIHTAGVRGMLKVGNLWEAMELI